MVKFTKYENGLLVMGLLFLFAGGFGFFLLNTNEALVALPGVSMAIGNLIFFVLARRRDTRG